MVLRRERLENNVLEPTVEDRREQQGVTRNQ
jgi:hypothetical protein